MRATVQKRDDSLVLHIPNALAEHLGVTEGAAVELTIMEGQLVMRPVAETPDNALEQLLDKITPDNLQTEVDTGAAQGREIG